MVTALHNGDAFFRCLVNKPMLPINPARPVARPVMLKWLRIAKTLERMARDVFKECISA